jgi:hypothetical protein
VAEYLVLRHEGAPHRARAIAATGQDDVDGLAALALAESLDLPIITKNPDLASRKIAVLSC